MLWIGAAVNVESGPPEIHVALEARSRRIVDNQSRFVFERNYCVDVIYCSSAVRPRVTTVPGDVHDHSILGANWPGETNAVEREVSVIRNAVVAECEHV